VRATFALLIALPSLAFAQEPSAWTQLPVAYNSVRPDVQAVLEVERDSRALRLTLRRGAAVLSQLTPASERVRVTPSSVISDAYADRDGTFPKPAPMEFAPPPKPGHYVYSSHTGKELARVECGSGFVALGPDGVGVLRRGEELVCYDARGKQRWVAPIGAPHQQVQLPPPYTHVVLFSQREGSSQGVVRVVSLNDGSNAATLSTSFAPFPSVVWAGPKAYVVTSSNGGGWEHVLTRHRYGDAKGTQIGTSYGYPDAIWLAGPTRFVLLKDVGRGVVVKLHDGDAEPSSVDLRKPPIPGPAPASRLLGMNGKAVDVRLADADWRVSFDASPPTATRKTR
jgi:hypothetical protein